MTELPLSVNFLLYRPGIRVRIPIQFVNEDQSAELKRGSFLVQVNKFVECLCEDTIPPTITTDVADIQKGDIIRLSALCFPPNTRPAPAVPLDFVAAVVRSGRSK